VHISSVTNFTLTAVLAFKITYTEQL
jgi:hypothetical protein